MWAERGFDSHTLHQFKIIRSISLMVERGSSKAQARVRFSHTAPTLALVAQWSEQSAHNRLVGGSNPSGGTYLFKINFLYIFISNLALFSKRVLSLSLSINLYFLGLITSSLYLIFKFSKFIL